MKRVKLPYIVYSDRTSSITERCISHIDDIQLAVLKKRNLFSKMAPGPRIAVDQSLLRASVEIGGKSYNILEMIGLFPKTGVLPYASKNEFGDGDASNRPPIDFLPSGIVEDIQILIADIQDGVNMIRSVTGINEVADGSTQQGDMLVRVMEGFNAATNNALKPHYRIYSGLYESSAKYIAQKWQVAVLDGDIDIRYIPINDNVLKTVKLSEGVYEYDFGIRITLVPSEQDLQIMLQDLLAKRANGAISEADYFVLYNMIRSRDFKKAQLFMARAVEEEMARKQQIAIQNTQAQAQAQAQAGIAIEQEKQKTIQLQHQLETERLLLVEQEKRKTLAMELEYKKEENASKLEGDLQKTVVSKSMDIASSQENV